MSDNKYTIKYVDSEHWGPELPRIMDSLGKRFAICDDIDAADIILNALNTPIASSSERAQSSDYNKAEALSNEEGVSIADDFSATSSDARKGIEDYPKLNGKMATCFLATNGLVCTHPLGEGCIPIWLHEPAQSYGKLSDILNSQPAPTNHIDRDN